MPNPFRDMSVFMQVLVAVAIAVVLVVLGLYLPFSPVQATRDQVDKAVQEKTQLNLDVQRLQVYRQRYGELRQQMDALSKQLETLKTIVPEDKEVDEFIRLLQGAAGASNVQVRRLTTLPLVAKEYHFEAPFDIQVDGPYFNILDFFSRLSHLSRIINVSDLNFHETESGGNQKYPLRPGTTVTGTFTATTFFTKPAEAVSSAQPGKAAAKPAGRP